MDTNQPGPGGTHALWLDRHTIAWPTDLELHRVRPALFLCGREPSKLHYAGQFTVEQLAKFPFLKGRYVPVQVDLPADHIKSRLRNALWIEARIGNTIVARTGIQVAGVIDDLFGCAVNETLGLSWTGGVPTLRLWAPTAWHVALIIWNGGKKRTILANKGDNGVWFVVGKPDWEDAEYLWAITVYSPVEDRLVNNHVTDPYSVGLTPDSRRSVLLDLDNPRWLPRGATPETPRPLRNKSAQAIYELHVRDFSIGDHSVPTELRGTYLAFTVLDSVGMRHLRNLAEAGLTTIHLLPTFDFASVPEKRSEQLIPQIPSAAGPASTEQQGAIAPVADVDGFNWGYDPLHWSTPEGSYATEGHQIGGERTKEFREMVKSLHNLGLRVVLDQVFNHTYQGGQGANSVLDKVVPGYYYRLSSTGEVETSTCCPNVATENLMAEKMMVDSIVLWAKYYGVDGFRFDLMGHHSKQTMEKVQSALRELTLENSGVDGSQVYLYGEGWNFGEVADDARFVQARQNNLAGTGIGCFNDRLRDAVRGGSPLDFDFRAQQGYGTGLVTDPNEVAASGLRGDLPGELARLEYYKNLIRLGLAGNLKEFSVNGPSAPGMETEEIVYNGQPAGFAAEPEENVNYVDAHDDLTLFDVAVWKLPLTADGDCRVRMNALCLAAVMLGQSPAFWHAGTEILRSKSLDRNSYNSGDHFNAIDWTLETNTFASGLPIASENYDRWDQMRPLLADASLRPNKTLMETSSQMALDLLRLRSSSPLFTLGSAAAIKACVSFPPVDVSKQPGLLLMLIENNTGADPNFNALLVAFNAASAPVRFPVRGLAGRRFELHPVQQKGTDRVVKQTSWDLSVGVITVPARTVAVLVEYHCTSEKPG